jgi:hypothetical protein
MRIPPQYVGDLDHRITALMSFTVRRETGWFGLDHGESRRLGDVYRASLEGAGVTLRALIEFLGVKSCWVRGKIELGDNDNTNDLVLGFAPLASLARITKADLEGKDKTLADFIAKMHDDASKRTAHPAFNKLRFGLNPDDLAKATAWAVTEIWQRCYDPDPITIHGDLYALLKGGRWKNVPFQQAKNADLRS